MKADMKALDLIGRYLDGRTTAEETAQLEALMLADAWLRAEFLACARVDAALRTALSAKAMQADTTEHGVVRPRVIRWKTWAPLAAAAAVIVACVLLFDGLGTPRNAAVAHFAALDACQWMDSATKIAPGDGISLGQRIAVAAGKAEVRFATGARLTLIGPAIFEVQSNNGGFLSRGEAQVTAETDESKGFTLETPTSKFVDIGTAFSAGVAADGLSRVNVTEGIVDVLVGESDSAHRLWVGESMFVEPGEKRIVTRIEAGEGTPAFHFPTIPPPSRDDAADRSQARASVRVVRGKMPGGSADVLLDGIGQSKQDSPRESAYFAPGVEGAILLDLGRAAPIQRIHSYSWHQHKAIPEHRERARQRFTLYGWAGDDLPDVNLPPEQAGWTRIARVNTDESLRVETRLDRPAQQACAISSEAGDIGRFRYLLWQVQGGTFYGEIDVFTGP